MKNTSNKGPLFAVIALLVIAVLGLGFAVTTLQADKPDFSIDISEDGLDVETN